MARHVPPEPPQDPHAPGPFSLCDPAHFGAILDRVGWRDVEFHQWRGDQLVGGSGASAAEAADFILSAMPFGEALRQAGSDALAAGTADLTAALARYQASDGIRAPASAWFVTARA